MRKPAALRGTLKQAALALSRWSSAVLTTTRLIWRRAGLRSRIAVGSVAAFIAFASFAAFSLVGTAHNARDSVTSLMNTTASVTPAGLLEPGLYLALSQEAAEVELAVRSLDTRLGWMGPLAWVPGLGDRLNEARNLAGVGKDLAAGARRVLFVYGLTLEQVRSSRVGAVPEVLAAHSIALAEAEDSLSRAGTNANRPLPLSQSEVIFLKTVIGGLQTMANLTEQDPMLTEAVFDLFDAAARLDRIANAPFDAMLDPTQLSEAVATMNQVTSDLTAHTDRLLEGTPNSETIGHFRELLSVVAELGQAGDSLVGMTTAMELGMFSPAFGETVGHHLQTAANAIDTASQRFDAYAGVASTDLPRLTGSTPQAITSVQRAIKDIKTPIGALRSALGYEGQRRYLVVMQNQNEIRATGGFIGAVVELPLTNGVLGDIVFDDSLFVDVPPLVNNPPAPEPLYWYLWSSRLLFRDANWNPHFPSSAETLIDLYSKKRNVPIDGVISATKPFALDMVGVLGTVRLPGLNNPITEAEANQHIEGQRDYPCREDHISIEPKRCFDEDLIPVLLDGLRSSLSGTQRQELLRVLQRHLERKDIMAFATDSQVQNIIADNDWAGAVPNASGDLLMVVDSALPGHSAATTTRSIDYQVALDPSGSSSSTLRVRYHNDAPRPEGSACRQGDQGGGPCYWNYFRIFLPRSVGEISPPTVGLHEGMEKLVWGYTNIDSGATVVHASPGLDGLTEVGGYLVVEPGDTTIVPLSYDLTPAALRRVGPKRYEYTLTAVRQSGIANDTVRVRIFLPDGAHDLFTSPPTMTRSSNSVEWSVDSPNDTQISVRFSTP